MEIWLILAIVAALAEALYVFLDNYITDVFFKGRMPQAQKVFFGPACLLTALIMAIIFPIHFIGWGNIFGLITAGVIASLALIPYFLALGGDEATDVTILEQISPIFYLIFGWMLLGESISGIQLVAFLVILTAPLTIILSARKRSKNVRIKTTGLMLIKVLTTAFANIMIVKFGCDCDFITMLFFVTVGKGIGDTAISLCCKGWRQRFKHVAKKNRGKLFGILTIDHIVWLVAEFAYYIALVIAPAVAMASAVTKTLQPLSVFVFGLVFSILWPNFGREKMDKRTVRTHLIATILAVIGIILMQSG